MQVWLQRIRLEEELLVIVLLGSFAQYNKLRTTVFSTFLLVFLGELRHAHESGHFADRIINPSLLFTWIFLAIENSHHKRLQILYLPLESLIDKQNIDSLYLKEFFNDLLLHYIHPLIHVADPITQNMQQELVSDFFLQGPELLFGYFQKSFWVSFWLQ